MLGLVLGLGLGFGLGCRRCDSLERSLHVGLIGFGFRLIRPVPVFACLHGSGVSLGRVYSPSLHGSGVSLGRVYSPSLHGSDGLSIGRDGFLSGCARGGRPSDRRVHRSPCA
eukprot:scaffold121216_cov63-Phaeocystis_antarctica.AAC.2